MATPHLGDRLTRRETDVLAGIAAGQIGRTIADRLGIAETTVETYLRGARTKLGTHTRAETVWAAGQRGDLTAARVDAARRP